MSYPCYDYEENFVNGFNSLKKEIHKTAKEKGWWDKERNDGECIALMHSERELASMYGSLSKIKSTVPWTIKEFSPEWAAGFVDGEGHFGVCKHKRKINGRIQYLTRVQIGNTERYLLEPFSVFGGSVKTVDAARWNPNAATFHKWTCHNRQAQDFTLAILPFLKNNKKIEAAKALLAIEFLRKKPGGNKIDNIRQEQQEYYYQQILKANMRGLKSDELRKMNPASDKIPEFNSAEEEFADVIVRIMDLSEARGWRVAEALLAKIEMNKTREKMHCGKKF